MNAKWNVTFDKFMSEDEVTALRKTLEAAVIIAKSKAHQGPVRDQCLLLLALGTGLRVSEIAALKIEDIDLKRGGNTLVVLRGKGDRLRQVKFSSTLKHLSKNIWITVHRTAFTCSLQNVRITCSRLLFRRCLRSGQSAVDCLLDIQSTVAGTITHQLYFAYQRISD